LRTSCPTLAKTCITAFAIVLSLAASATGIAADKAYERINHRAPSLTASTLPSGGVDLAWPAYKDSLYLERRFLHDEYYAILAVFGPSQSRYQDSTLPPDTPAFYRLRPARTRYLAEFGREIVVQISYPPLPRPELSRLSADSVLIRIAQTGIKAVPIVIERRIGGVFSSVGRAAIGQTVFIDTGLRAGSYAHYRLRYENDEQGNSLSPDDSVLMELSSLPELALSYANDHTVRLSWKPAGHFYGNPEIERDAEGKISIIPLPLGALSWTDSSLGYAQRTNYRLRSVAGADTSEFGPAVSAYYVVKPVQSLVADPVHDLTVRLQWIASDSLTNEFIIERSADSLKFSELARLNGRTFAYTEAIGGRDSVFYYRIVSQTSHGVKAFSAAVCERIPRLEEGMVWVPESTAAAGCYIDACETTVAQYLTFCQSSGREPPQDPAFPGHPGYWNLFSQLPAVNLSWKDAVAYCNWRSRAVGIPTAYDSAGALIPDAQGYRLPDREHFLRALQIAGDTLANLFDAGVAAAQPIASPVYAKRPTRIYNLRGNVWEWTEAVTPDGGYVILGGAYSTPRKLAESVPEFCYRADFVSPTIGFRCMLISESIREATGR
jgi:hypothetical protein